VVPEADLLPTAVRFAEDMLLASPDGLRMTKQILNDAPGSLAAALAREDLSQLHCLRDEACRLVAASHAMRFLQKPGASKL
jgi:enoyl-CoA hydratase/carnithine racemase